MSVVSRMLRTRSAPTAACAIAFVVVARSFTGLKKFVRYARYTVSSPIVIAPFRMSAEPRQRTIAVHTATVVVTTGERIAFILRALRAAATVAWLTLYSSASSVCSWPNAFTT